MHTRHEHWIGGRPVAPADGRYIASVDPSTGSPGDDVAAGSAPDVEAAVAAAFKAQTPWAAASAGERSALLHRTADLIGEHADELMELERACTGKTPAQLRMEIEMSCAYFRYYAGVVRAHHGRVIDQGGSNHTYTRFEPYGVVAIITPWNFPLNQACRGAAPALAAGNAVVAKPSEFTSTSTLRLARLASEAGLPDGLFNVVTGTGPEVGQPLVADPRVRRIAFTGSVATGRRLAAMAAERLIPMTLELGGKSPMVVFADADLDRVVQAAVSSAAMNAGQVCSATSRLLIQREVHDHLVGRITEAMERLQPGVDYGPMITQAQFDKVLEFFERAKAEGSLPCTGGDTVVAGVAPGGRYIRPTLYADVDPRSPLAREEIFGPVLVTMAFDNEVDALTAANDTDYGLVASVWSGDVARALRLAEQVQAGQVSVNGGALTIEAPFGGYKNSGYGREKGLEALHDYAQIKTISLSLS